MQSHPDVVALVADGEHAAARGEAGERRERGARGNRRRIRESGVGVAHRPRGEGAVCAAGEQGQGGLVLFVPRCDVGEAAHACRGVRRVGRERHDVWQLHRVFLVASVVVVVEAFADFESKNEKK